MAAARRDAGGTGPGTSLRALARDSASGVPGLLASAEGKKALELLRAVPSRGSATPRGGAAAGGPAVRGWGRRVSGHGPRVPLHAASEASPCVEDPRPRMP
ncbi:hypothetical protein NN561_006325 [Cricetulus griseus]